MKVICMITSWLENRAGGGYLMKSWIQKLSPELLDSEFVDHPEQHVRFIVEMVAPEIRRVGPYVKANSGVIQRQFSRFPWTIIEMPYGALQPLAMAPYVRRIWQDTKVKALLDIAVPTTGSSVGQGLGYTGKDITVAIIDTGIAPHPDLTSPQNRIIGWNDLVNGRTSPYDDNGHGTHVAGIVAGNGWASRGKYTGMAPEANLVGIKALDKEGTGNISDILVAIEWCLEHQSMYNIRVINLSLGAPAYQSAANDPLCAAVRSAWDNGIVVCVAAGNDGPGARTINTPGIEAKAITVGNLDDRGTVDPSDDIVNESSSVGPTIDNQVKPDLLAPGTNIISLKPSGGYQTMTGTSMATPMVAGAVAQILQQKPGLKPEQVKRILKQNARDMGLRSYIEGAGALSVEKVFEEEAAESRGIIGWIVKILSRIPLFQPFLTRQPAI